MIGVGEWATQALERADGTPTARHADIYGSAAYRALVLGDHASAERLARIAVEDGIDPESWSPGLAYVTLAYSALALGRHDEVVPIISEAAERTEEVGCDAWKCLQVGWTRASYEALLGRSEARAPTGTGAAWRPEAREPDRNRQRTARLRVGAGAGVTGRGARDLRGGIVRLDDRQ